MWHRLRGVGWGSCMPGLSNSSHRRPLRKKSQSCKCCLFALKKSLVRKQLDAGSFVGGADALQISKICGFPPRGRSGAATGRASVAAHDAQAFTDWGGRALPGALQRTALRNGRCGVRGHSARRRCDRGTEAQCARDTRADASGTAVACFHGPTSSIDSGRDPRGSPWRFGRRRVRSGGARCAVAQRLW